MKNDSHQEFLRRYKTIHEPFVRYCRSKAFGILETEDLVQEAILATLKNFKSIQDKNKLLPYLIGIVNNLVKNKKRQTKFQGSWNEHLLESLCSKNLNPEVALDIHFLLLAINKLPAKQQEAIILFEISGFSIREISELQDSSESATKTRLSRARQLLRKQFNEQPKKHSLSATLAAYASILL